MSLRFFWSTCSKFRGFFSGFPSKKMSKREASDSDTDKVFTDDHDNTYVPTAVYKELQNTIRNRLTIGGRNVRYCLVGAKGVGKSSLLTALFTNLTGEYKEKAKHLNLQFPLHLEELSQIINDLGDDKYNCSILFVDNVQLLMPSGMKVLLKSDIEQLNVLVCASSRAGLVTLMSDKTFRLNPGDMPICVVNPEEEVTNTIFELQKQKYKIQIAEENEELVKACLVKTGHLPEDAINLVWLESHDSDKIELFTRTLEVIAIRSLTTDNKFFEPDNTAQFLKFLTICAADGIKFIDLIKSLGLQLADLPWTMLKMGKDTTIKPVSPLCKEVMQNYIADTPDTCEQVLKLMNKFNLPYGNFRGLVFEKVVHKALGKVEKFTYYDSTGEATVVTLGIITMTTNRAKYIDCNIADSTCVLTQCMEGCDVLLKVKGQLYFIQCTVDKLEKKVGCWKHAPAGAISLLVTPRCDHVFAMDFAKRNSAASKMFLVDADFIASDDIEYLK